MCRTNSERCAVVEQNPFFGPSLRELVLLRFDAQHIEVTQCFRGCPVDLMHHLLPHQAACARVSQHTIGGAVSREVSMSPTIYVPS